MPLDLVQGSTRAALKAALRTYLTNDLLGQGDVPIWIAGRWNTRTQTYTQVFRDTFKRYCGVLAASASLLITQDGARQDFSQFVRTNVRIPDDVRVLMEECVRPGSKTRAILLKLNISYAWHPSGHAALLVFDVQRRMQIMFDPDDSLMNANNTRSAFSFTSAFADMQEPLLPGFACAAASEMGYTRFGERLQRFFQGVVDSEHHGLCGVLVQVVAMCCARFAYWNPKDISDMIKELFVNRNQRENLVYNMIGWYDRVCDANLSAELFQQKVHPPSSIGCKCFSAKMGRMCSRASCREGQSVFCWQHRHLLQNIRQTRSKKCGARQSPCRLGND